MAAVPQWVIRDDVPQGACTCHLPALGGGSAHSTWCDAVRRPGGVFYYVGRDIEGHWWMGRERAATFPFRVAQRLRRDLFAGGRRLALVRA